MQLIILAIATFGFAQAQAYHLSCSDAEQVLKITSSAEQFSTSSEEYLSSSYENYVATAKGFDEPGRLMESSYITHAPKTTAEVYWATVSLPGGFTLGKLVLCNIIKE
ncbi:MAG: hypothetical protein AAF202_02175 [Pseudomonadota bacterium]